jgi:hypothetical protein
VIPFIRFVKLFTNFYISIFFNRKTAWSYSFSSNKLLQVVLVSWTHITVLLSLQRGLQSHALAHTYSLYVVQKTLLNEKARNNTQISFQFVRPQENTFRVFVTEEEIHIRACSVRARRLILTFLILEVSLRTTRFNIQKFYVVIALRWVFCTDLRTNSDFCFTHSKLVFITVV